LNICTKEDIEKYHVVIKNDREFTSFNSFERLLRTEDYISDKLATLRCNRHGVDILGNDYIKMLIIRKFERLCEIKKLDFDNINPTFVKLDKKFIYSIKNNFRWKTIKANTVEDISNIYKKMLVHICGLDLWKTTRVLKDGERCREKSINIDQLNWVMNLIILKSGGDLRNYDYNIINTLRDYIEIPNYLLTGNGQEKRMCEIEYNCDMEMDYDPNE
jgi:hypothetical protein